MTHEDLIQEAEDAISRLFGDKSVSQAETKESLYDLIGFIETMIETLGE